MIKEKTDLRDPDDFRQEGIIPGRFQPFHYGHKKMIDRYKDIFDHLLVGIGLSRRPNSNDPLHFYERKKILEEEYKNDQVSIFPVDDQGDKEKWIKEVEVSLGLDSEKKELYTVVTGNDHTRECFEDQDYWVEFLEEEDQYFPELIKGHKIRDLITEGEDWWETLVPESTLNVLDRHEIDLKSRINELRDLDEERDVNWTMKEMDY